MFLIGRSLFNVNKPLHFGVQIYLHFGVQYVYNTHWGTTLYILGYNTFWVSTCMEGTCKYNTFWGTIHTFWGTNIFGILLFYKPLLLRPTCLQVTSILQYSLPLCHSTPTLFGLGCDWNAWLSDKQLLSRVYSHLILQNPSFRQIVYRKIWTSKIFNIVITGQQTQVCTCFCDTNCESF